MELTRNSKHPWQPFLQTVCQHACVRASTHGISALRKSIVMNESQVLYK